MLWIVIFELMFVFVLIELPSGPSAGGDNVLMSILSGICGALCAENPLGQAFGKTITSIYFLLTKYGVFGELNFFAFVQTLF